ncbi:MAG: transcriptional regulator BetI [Arenicella sp.]
MPKLGMEPIRRAQLIDASMECIYQNGLAGTTISKVSRLAGVSTGVVNHYFGSKNQLLEATMRELLKQISNDVISGTRSAKTSKEQLMAIIDGNFTFEQVNPRSTNTWLAFWAEAMHEPTLARLQRVNMRRLRSNLRHILKQLLPTKQALMAADGLAALIDGLWLRGAFQSKGIDTDEAKNICKNYVDLQLKYHIDNQTR